MRLQNAFKIIFWLLFVVILTANSVAFASPQYTTYSAKIFKSDGSPLENNRVDFKFTVMDPTATCSVFSEMFAAINMTGSNGNIAITLGSGTRSYPTSGTMVFVDSFKNSGTFSCEQGSTYSPLTTSTRKVVMQFNDGTGWQTVSPMQVNSVPYANYSTLADTATSATTASNALALNGKLDTDFVTKPVTCTTNQILSYNGSTFSCVNNSGGGGGGSGIESITSSSASLVIGGTASAPVLSLTTASASSAGVLSAADYTRFDAAATASTAASSSAVVNTIVRRDSSGNASFNGVTTSTISANSTSVNNVDIYKAATSNYVRLQAPVGLSSSYVLSLPVSAGVSGQVLQTDGSGNLSWMGLGGLAGKSSIDLTADVSGVLPEANGGTQWTTSGTTINYNSGNIGIGTSNPISKLHISGGDIATNRSVQIGDASGNYGLGFNGWSEMIQGSSSSRYIRFLTNNNEVARFNSTGYLGLGTSSPTSTLDVSGTISITGFSTSIKSYRTGTSDTTGRFDIFSNSTDTNGPYLTMFGPNHSVKPGNLEFVSNGNGSIKFINQRSGSWNKWITMLYTGNVGIGTEIPSYTLDVSGTINTNTGYRFPDGTTQTTAYTGGGGGTVSSVTSANGYLTVMNSTTTPVLSVNVGTASGTVAAGNDTRITGALQASNNLSDIASSATARANLGLGNSGVTAATYGSVNAIPSITVDALGRITSAVANAYQYGSVINHGILRVPTGSNLTVLDGDLSLTGSNVISALGYTPVSASAASQWTTSGTRIYYNGGQVGIGAVPTSAKLHVLGDIVALAGNDPYFAVSAPYLKAPVSTGHSPSPVYSFWYQSNTGISNPSANEIGFMTNTYERMRIDLQGHVGIGTSSPTVRLDVRASDNSTIASFGNTSNLGAMEIRSQGTNQSQMLAFKRMDGAYDQFSLSPSSGSHADTQVESAGGFSFNSDSQGFGLSSSSSYGMFDFRSGNGLTSTTGMHNYFYIKPSINQSGTAGYNGLYIDVTESSVGNGNKNIANFSVGGSSKVVIDSNGRLGIGTETPSYTLDVSGTVNIASGSALRFGGTQVCTSTGCTSSSDERLKENILPLKNSLEKVLTLEGVEYDYKDKLKFSDKKQVGVIAQNVEKVFPEVVITDQQTGLKSVAYDHLVAPLIEATKALFYKIVNVERNLASVKTEADLRLKKLEDENAVLKDYICSKDPKAPFCKK